MTRPRTRIISIPSGEGGAVAHQEVADLDVGLAPQRGRCSRRCGSTSHQSPSMIFPQNDVRVAAESIPSPFDHLAERVRRPAASWELSSLPGPSRETCRRLDHDEGCRRSRRQPCFGIEAACRREMTFAPRLRAMSAVPSAEQLSTTTISQTCGLKSRRTAPIEADSLKVGTTRLTRWRSKWSERQR